MGALSGQSANRPRARSNMAFRGCDQANSSCFTCGSPNHMSLDKHALGLDAIFSLNCVAIHTAETILVLAACSSGSDVGM